MELDLIPVCSGESDGNPSQNEESEVSILEKQKVQLPRKYKVLLHNDDYTTMEVVILVLKKFFNKSFEEAQAIMLSVHNTGSGVCGIYTFEVAESKVQKVNRFSKEHGHPLKCSYEPE